MAYKADDTFSIHSQDIIEHESMPIFGLGGLEPDASQGENKAAFLPPRRDSPNMSPSDKHAFKSKIPRYYPTPDASRPSSPMIQPKDDDDSTVEQSDVHVSFRTGRLKQLERSMTSNIPYSQPVLRAHCLACAVKHTIGGPCDSAIPSYLRPTSASIHKQKKKVEVKPMKVWKPSGKVHPTPPLLDSTPFHTHKPCPSIRYIQSQHEQLGRKLSSQSLDTGMKKWRGPPIERRRHNSLSDIYVRQPARKTSGKIPILNSMHLSSSNPPFKNQHRSQSPSKIPLPVYKSFKACGTMTEDSNIATEDKEKTILLFDTDTQTMDDWSTKENSSQYDCGIDQKHMSVQTSPMRAQLEKKPVDSSVEIVDEAIQTEEADDGSISVAIDQITSHSSQELEQPTQLTSNDESVAEGISSLKLGVGASIALVGAGSIAGLVAAPVVAVGAASTIGTAAVASGIAQTAIAVVGVVGAGLALASGNNIAEDAPSNLSQEKDDIGNDLNADNKDEDLVTEACSNNSEELENTSLFAEDYSRDALPKNPPNAEIVESTQEKVKDVLAQQDTEKLEWNDMNQIHEFVLPVVQLAARKSFPLAALKKSVKVEGQIEFDKDGRVLEHQESRTDINQPSEEVDKLELITKNVNVESISASTSDLTKPSVYRSLERQISRETVLSAISESSNLSTLTDMGSNVSSVKERMSWKKSIRRRRPSVDMKDLTALAAAVSKKFKELEACHKLLQNLSSDVSGSYPSSSALKASKQGYGQTAQSIVSLGRGISSSWTPVAEACEDSVLRSHLLNSLERMETLSSQLKAVISQRMSEMSDCDAAGSVLAAAKNLVESAQVALADLEAAKLCIEPTSNPNNVTTFTVL